MEMKPRNEAEHFEEVMKTKHKDVFEIDDRIEQAYRQGFIAGTKFTAGKEMATITECMMKAITKAAVQAINCVNYDAVYSSYKAEETAEKHWSECRQISAYEAENKRLKELLLYSMSKIVKACVNCDCQLLSAECKSRPIGKECFRWEYYEEAMKIIKGEE